MSSKQKSLKWKRQPKGVTNRNRALEWILENATNGVLYFADDDNTYDTRIFDLIRWEQLFFPKMLPLFYSLTRQVSVFPVGLIGKLGLSSPVVPGNGSLTGFYDHYNGGRTFKVDMAGFAVSVQFYR